MRRALAEAQRERERGRAEQSIHADHGSCCGLQECQERWQATGLATLEYKEAEKNKQLRSQRRGEAREVESREVRGRGCQHAVLCNALAWHATSSARNSLQRDHGLPVLARNMICSAAHSVSRTWVAEPEVGEIRARSRTAVGPCP